MDRTSEPTGEPDQDADTDAGLAGDRADEQPGEEPLAESETSAEDQPVDDHEDADVPGRDGKRTAAVLAVVIALALGGLSTWALIRTAGADHQQACIAKAGVKYGSAKAGENGLITIARNRALATCTDSAF